MRGIFLNPDGEHNPRGTISIVSPLISWVLYTSYKVDKF